MNCFYTDNPGVFCCNIIHRSQAEPLSRGDIAILGPTTYVLCGNTLTLVGKHLQNFVSKFTFCSSSPSVRLGWCLSQCIQLFWVGYNLGILRPFCFTSLCSWCFGLSACRASTLSILCRVTSLAWHSLTACPGANVTSSRGLGVLMQPLVSTGCPVPVPPVHQLSSPAFRCS